MSARADSRDQFSTSKTVPGESKRATKSGDAGGATTRNAPSTASAGGVAAHGASDNLATEAEQSPSADTSQIIDPEANVGRQLSFLDQIQAHQSISQGRWLLVMFHYDCLECRKSFPAFQDRARNGERIAFVEIPPLAPAAERIVKEDPAWVVTRLDDKKVWFFPMLTRFELEDGIVRKAWSGATSDADGPRSDGVK
jgi:hypothetical protein